MRTSINNWARLHGIASPRLRVILLVALAWLAPGAGPARADFVVYDFTGSSNSGVTVSGSFEVNLDDILTYKGALPESALQMLQFKTSDGLTFNTFDTSQTYRFKTFGFSPYAVENAALHFTSPGNPGYTLGITGPSGGKFQWIENTPNEGQTGGTGTFTSEVSAVPAPPGFILFATGACCAAAYAWRRRRLAVA